jgi:hypothetical protein
MPEGLKLGSRHGARIAPDQVFASRLVTGCSSRGDFFFCQLSDTAPNGVGTHPKPAEPEPNKDFERAPPSAVRAILDDLPIHIRPNLPAARVQT